MVRCSYCGRENATEALACRECGTRFFEQANRSGWKLGEYWWVKALVGLWILIILFFALTIYFQEFTDY